MFEYSISNLNDVLQKSINLDDTRICSYRLCGDGSIQIIFEFSRKQHSLIFTKYGGDYVKINCSNTRSSSPRRYILVQARPLIDYLSDGSEGTLADFLTHIIVNWTLMPDVPDIGCADYIRIVDTLGSKDCSLHICSRITDNYNFPNNRILEKVVHIPGKDGIDEDFAFSINATGDVILRYSRYSSAGLLEDLERSYNDPIQEITEFKETDENLIMSYLSPSAIPILLMVEEIRKIKEKM